MNIDETYMSRALQLAKNGFGRVSPNPMVGAVVVADGRIMAKVSTANGVTHTPRSTQSPLSPRPTDGCCGKAPSTSRLSLARTTEKLRLAAN